MTTMKKMVIKVGTSTITQGTCHSMGLKELTSYKWVVRGGYAIRK